MDSCRTRRVGGLSWVVVAAVTAADLLVGPAAAWACRTPVYRYAMYNWSPAPYRVYCFYRGKLPSEAEKVQAALPTPTAAVEEGNIVFRPVNLDDSKAYSDLPALVKRLWDERAGQQQTGYLVLTPWGTPLLAGELKPEAVAALVDSPVRQSIGHALHTGSAGVFVLLRGQDDAQNRQAETLIEAAIKSAASGKIPIASSVGGADPGDPAADKDDDKKSHDDQRWSTLKLARVSLAPDDREETWLVRMLMQSEAGLDEYAGQPMVFMAYGRGRVMPPLVGKGVTAENLSDCVSFIGGACSCQVKDENPGADLLMQWDWEATAERLAADDPERDESPADARDLMPPAQPAPATPAAIAASAARAKPAAAAQPPAASPPVAAATSHSPDPSAGGAAPQSPPHPTPAATSSAAGETAAGTMVEQQLWLYGLGVGAAVVLVVVAGLFLRRPS